jgi:hypothetical protein
MMHEDPVECLLEIAKTLRTERERMDLIVDLRNI